MKTIDLRAMTAEAFGYSPLIRYQMPAEPQPTERPTAVPAGAELHGSGRGLLNLPVFCRITIQDVHTTEGGTEGMELLDPIITVGQPMRIVSTEIAGRKGGTVKEFISQSDYAVTIRGIMATDPFAENRFAYPLPQVQKMVELVGLGVALPVSGWLLDVFGVKNLVIQNASYESLPGFTNLQAYELQCLSDEPIELTL